VREAEASDPVKLKARIRELEQKLKSSPAQTKEVKVADPKAIENAVRSAQAEMRKDLHSAAVQLDRVRKIALDLVKATDARPAIPEKMPVLSNPVRIIPKSIPAQPVETNGNKLRAGAERMLAALATWHPNGMSEGQMRAHAGMKRSGTFSAYMSDLRKGYIEERDGLVFSTEHGLAYCQHIPAAPQSTEEVLEVWKPKLRDGARRMLDALVQRGGEPISKEELGEMAGLQKSGTFSAYLSDLKTARLAVVNRDGTVAANKESLFL
jgi:hypothetical protein